MSIKRIILSSIIISAVFTICSCTQDSDTYTYSNSFQNDPDFASPAFVNPGDRFMLVPSKVKRATDDTCTLSVGYYWNVDLIKSSNDTTRYEGEDATLNNGSYILVAPDTLESMLVACYAYADGYYTSGMSTYCTIVTEEGSLTNLDLDSTKTFIDDRDGMRYFYTVIGDTYWMSKNLAYAGTEDNVLGSPYGDCEVMNPVLGRLYNWEDAMRACPEGWRLPNQSDFNKLAKFIDAGSVEYKPDEIMPGLSCHFMSDAYFNGNKMWEYWPKVKIDNLFGTCIVPAGYATINTDGKYEYLGANYRATQWLSDEYNKDKAYIRYIYVDDPDLRCYAGDKKYFATTVRCVKN